MKKIFLSILFSVQLIAYAQQQVNFRIDVSLNDREHVLDGFEKIEYTNTSPDTLHYIWFHIWPNAFKSDKTAYSESLLKADKTDFYFSDQEQRGYINRLDFKVNGVTARTEDHPGYIDIIKLVLPEPLLPGRTIVIATPFHVQLPYNFSGNGHVRRSYQVAEWYPKPAVYDKEGWHIMPYVYDKPLFSEAGNYDVQITVPKGYLLAAEQGKLVDSQQIDTSMLFHFKQNNIQNFAWYADKKSIEKAKYQEVSAKQKYFGSELIKRIERKLSDPKIKPVSILPAAGYNAYDGFLIGALVHNYRLPEKKFQFLIAPLYGTQSKKINGIARASYTWQTEGPFSDIQAGAGISHFSYADAGDIVLNKVYAGFTKMVPFVKLILKKRNKEDKTIRYMQLKHFYINEEDFRYELDTVNNGWIANVVSDNTNITQLNFDIENQRKLYPYKGKVTIEKNDYFVKTAFEGKYYFNYANNKTGLKARLFAGKLFYTGSRSSAKPLSSYRYFLNLSGPIGVEDYTYSNYFAGRDAFEGWKSQQLMIRDGGFRVRTDILDNEVGRTDDWLAAINLTSDIPDEFNPFSRLPIKIPLKLFADLGTYAEAWGKGSASDRFLFNGGVQLSLFKEMVNIYLPLVYSNVYKDYFNSILGDKKFLKKISFSIDLDLSAIFPSFKHP